MKYRFYLNLCTSRAANVISRSSAGAVSRLGFLFRKLVGKLVLATGLPRTFEIGRVGWVGMTGELGFLSSTSHLVHCRVLMLLQFIPSGISASVSNEMSTRNCYLPLELSKRSSLTFCCRLDDEKLDLINVSNFDKTEHPLL